MSKVIDDTCLLNVDELREKNKLNTIEAEFHRAYSGSSSLHGARSRLNMGLSEFLDEVKKDISSVNRVTKYKWRVDSTDSSEVLYDAYETTSQAFDELETCLEGLPSPLAEAEDKATDMCVQFQQLIDGTENILGEYETLLSLVEELHDKLETLEHSKWRIFEKYLTSS